MEMHLTSVQILEYLGILFGSGTAASVIAQIIKKSTKVKSEPIIHVVVVSVTTLAAIAQYVLTLKNLPPEIVGVSDTAIWGFATAVYKAAPAITKFFSQEQADEASLDKQPASVAIMDPIDAAVASLTATPANEPTVTDINAKAPFDL